MNAARSGEDPLRPRWRLRTPQGLELVAEYDRLRRHWRVIPGEYVRKNLRDALSQATGQDRNAAWMLEIEGQVARAATEDT